MQQKTRPVETAGWEFPQMVVKNKGILFTTDQV